MDTIKVYKFAYQTPEELSDGISGEDFREEHSELIKIIKERKEKILTPRFVGVYQFNEYLNHTNSPIEAEKIRRLKDEEENQRNEFSIARKKLTEIPETAFLGRPICPELICIAYDELVWNSNLVKESFQTHPLLLSRLTIKPFSELPNFYKKETGLFEIAKYEMTSDFCQINLQKMKEIAEEYGLTMEEDTILTLLKIKSLSNIE